MEGLCLEGSVILKDLAQIGYENVNKMRDAHDKDQWRALVNKLVKLGVS
jgi:hypothetical protein